MSGSKRHIKGVVVGQLVGYVREATRAGVLPVDPGWSAAAQTLVSGTPILPSTWYPYDLHLEILETVFVEGLKGDLAALVELGAEGAAAVYGDVHRGLIVEGDPEAALRQLNVFWRTCHDFGHASADVGDRQARVCVRDALPMTKTEGYGALGWIRGILAESGARDLEASVVDGPWDSPSNVELTLAYRWG